MTALRLSVFSIGIMLTAGSAHTETAEMDLAGLLDMETDQFRPGSCDIRDRSSNGRRYGVDIHCTDGDGSQIWIETGQATPQDFDFATAPDIATRCDEAENCLYAEPVHLEGWNGGRYVNFQSHAEQFMTLTLLFSGPANVSVISFSSDRSTSEYNAALATGLIDDLLLCGGWQSEWPNCSEQQ